jgi:hypothetical protein
MTRMDWILVRPPRRGRARRDDVRDIEQHIDLLELHARTELLSERQVAMIVDFEDQLESMTKSPCDAVKAPRVRDAEGWEERLEDEYAEEGTDEDFELWRADRADDYDCDRCPYASRYSLYPSDPCEMNAGPLLEICEGHTTILRMLKLPMTPAKMLAMAALLDECLDKGTWRAVEGIDAEDYLRQARHFLTRWSAAGFGVLPDLDADAPIHTPDGVLELKRRVSNAILH